MSEGPNGWFRLYRRALSEHDELWQERRERTKWEAWVDLISMAAYRDHDMLYDGKVIPLKRGEVPISERTLMERWSWGSRGKVRRFVETLEEIGRIERKTSLSRSGNKTDRKTDHPLTIIKICNYERYQDPEFRTGTKPDTEHGTEDGLRTDQTEEGKEGKEDPREEISRFRKGYSANQLAVIDRTFDAIGSTRKTGKVADSILLKELRYWAGFNPGDVVQACRTYLQKGYAIQGKREEYLRGILRGLARQPHQPASPESHPYQRLRP